MFTLKSVIKYFDVMSDDIQWNSKFMSMNICKIIMIGMMLYVAIL